MNFENRYLKNYKAYMPNAHLLEIPMHYNGNIIILHYYYNHYITAIITFIITTIIGII